MMPADIDSERAVKWLEANDRAKDDPRGYIINASGSGRRALARLIADVRREAREQAVQECLSWVEGSASVQDELTAEAQRLGMYEWQKFKAWESGDVAPSTCPRCGLTSSGCVCSWRSDNPKHAVETCVCCTNVREVMDRAGMNMGGINVPAFMLVDRLCKHFASSPETASRGDIEAGAVAWAANAEHFRQEANRLYEALEREYEFDSGERICCAGCADVPGVTSVQRVSKWSDVVHIEGCALYRRERATQQTSEDTDGCRRPFDSGTGEGGPNITPSQSASTPLADRSPASAPFGGGMHHVIAEDKAAALLAAEPNAGPACSLRAVVETIRNLKTGNGNDWNAALDRAIDAVHARFGPFGPESDDASPAIETARERWLTTPLGSLGRKAIQVKQYEELRALACKALGIPFESHADVAAAEHRTSQAGEKP